MDGRSERDSCQSGAEVDVIVFRESPGRYREISRETVQVGVSVTAKTFEDTKAGGFVCQCTDLGIAMRRPSAKEAVVAVRDELIERLRSVGLG